MTTEHHELKHMKNSRSSIQASKKNSICRDLFQTKIEAKSPIGPILFKSTLFIILKTSCNLWGDIEK